MPDKIILSRGQLLIKLFDLMEKSGNIRVLPAERKNKIKDKYRQAATENIISGIAMLEADVAQQKEREEKARAVLQKNIKAKKDLKKQEIEEKHESEKRAAELLEKISKEKEKGKKPRWCAVAILLILIGAVLLMLIIYGGQIPFKPGP